MDQNPILDIMKNEAEKNMEDIDKEQFKDSYNQVNNELKIQMFQISLIYFQLKKQIIINIFNKLFIKKEKFLLKQ